MADEQSLRVKTGDAIRIDGRCFIAAAITDDGRAFSEKATGHQIILSNRAQVRMAYEGRISSEAMYRALSAPIREAIATDWDAMTPSERETAQFRYRFIRRVQDLPSNKRSKSEHIQTAIDEAWAEHAREEQKPTVRSVRRWNRIYQAAGRDIRALTSLAFRRGRGPQLAPWIREEIHNAINEVYATQPAGTLADTRERAITRIRERAKREGRQLPALRPGQIDVIGINVVARVLKERDQYELLVAREGRAEADRLMEAVGEGPQGTYPLEAAEIDHTQLDIIIVDEERKLVLGRPWLTVIIDRYTRCILGFCLSFHPPSWTTVMEALRHAVGDKQVFLDELGGITNSWPCRGTPDLLVADNGRDFHSISMEETEAALNMRILYLPRKKGQLKGKVERWFRTMQDKIFHQIPGTTQSNILVRGNYISEAAAIMNLRQARWTVTKWIVDVYHMDQHSKTGEAPFDRWTVGIRTCGEKLPPPPGLLLPMTGMVVPGTLNREGVRFKGLRWNSNEFSALRNRLGINPHVQVRIDPLDLQHAYAYDPEKRRWVSGDLITTGVEAGLSLHQYEVIKKHARETQQPGEDRLAALARARGEIFDFVQEIINGNKKSKAGKRFARFYKDGRKPSEHIAKTTFDPEKSASPIGSYPIEPTPAAADDWASEKAEETEIEPLTVRRRSI